MFPTTSKNDPQLETPDSFTRQGSLRKVIPPAEVDRDNLFGRQNEDLNRIYKTYRQEYVILAEYKMIQSEDVHGVYVIPSRENPLIWFGVIFIRNGPYREGIFRFTINLDENFPDCGHPKVIFQSKIIHPVINPETNELNLLSSFPTWQKNEQHIWQVLKFVIWIFDNVEGSLNYAVNKEASDLFSKSKEEFTTKVQEFVEESKQRLYDPPPTPDKHYITFDQFNPEIHKMEKIIAFMQQKDEGKAGYSWVLPGNYKPLQRPPTPPSDGETRLTKSSLRNHHNIVPKQQSIKVIPNA